MVIYCPCANMVIYCPCANNVNAFSFDLSIPQNRDEPLGVKNVVTRLELKAKLLKVMNIFGISVCESNV